MMKIVKRDHLSFRPTNRNRDLIDRLDELAKLENRSPNNYIETVLLNHVNEKEQQLSGKKFA